jgi:hypothetical protein
MNSPIQSKQIQQPVESLDLSNLSFGTGLQGVIENALGVANKRGSVTSEGELSEGRQTANVQVLVTSKSDNELGNLNSRGSVTRFSSLSA